MRGTDFRALDWTFRPSDRMDDPDVGTAFCADDSRQPSRPPITPLYVLRIANRQASPRRLDDKVLSNELGAFLPKTGFPECQRPC